MCWYIRIGVFCIKAIIRTNNHEILAKTSPKSISGGLIFKLYIYASSCSMLDILCTLPVAMYIVALISYSSYNMDKLFIIIAFENHSKKSLESKGLQIY